MSVDRASDDSAPRERELGPLTDEAEDLFTVLADASPHGVVVLSLPDACVRWANPAATVLDTVPAGDRGTEASLLDLLPDEAAEHLRTLLDRLRATGQAQVDAATGALPGQPANPIHVSVHPVRWRGSPAALLEIRDLTDRVTVVHQAERLDLIEQRFRAAFDQAAIGMALVAVGPEPPAGTFLDANASMCAMVGRTIGELRAMTFSDVSHPDDVGLGMEVFGAVARDELDRGVVEKRYLRPDGREVWARVTVSAVRDSRGRPLHLVAQAEDITERKAVEAELEHRAMHDPLTDLPNRAYVLDHLERALARATRRDSQVAVLYLDIDDFKNVNDSLGHAVGDEVLIEMARRVQGALRGGDLAARLGGDELVVVCESLGQLETIGPIAQRIVDTVAEPLEVDQHVLHLTASVGVALGDATTTPDRLLADADAAMYAVKSSGKARYEVGDQFRAMEATRQISVHAGLHRALAEGGFRLVYQPIVDVADSRVVGVEALLRWVHPTRGVLAPAEFIDIAESHELIVPIGRWVIEEAVRQSAAWRAVLGPAVPRMWVNVSARQLGRGDLPALLRDTLAEAGLPAEGFGLELTEHQVVRTSHSLRNELAVVRDLGVGLAIDDFGTGRTGIDYLRELPITHLKVDRSFVAGLGVDTTNTALTDSMITLGHGLGLIVTAEGVEHEGQLDQLRAWGCDQVQGYFLARPDTPEVIAALIARSSDPSRSRARLP